jgi:hypothetical protein
MGHVNLEIATDVQRRKEVEQPLVKDLTGVGMGVGGTGVSACPRVACPGTTCPGSFGVGVGMGGMGVGTGVPAPWQAESKRADKVSKRMERWSVDIIPSRLEST